jgi:uroporphyrinogen-III synthase
VSGADPDRADAQQPPSPRSPRAAPGASLFRVAVTRPQESEVGESDRLSLMLEAAGAKPLLRPVLRVTYLACDDELLGALGRLTASERPEATDPRSPGSAPWLFVTSPRTVRPVDDALQHGGGGWGGLRKAGVRVAAVGRSTAAALQRAGAKVDLIPARYSGGDLLREFAAAVHGSGPAPCMKSGSSFRRRGRRVRSSPRDCRPSGLPWRW